MFKNLFFIFLLLCGTSYAADSSISITLEHATTPEALTWGLMQRDHLDPNHGMLFHLPKTQKISMWMFNCKIDLSAAVLDSNGIILDILTMPQYYQMMDPKRPVNSLKDIMKYPQTDPIFQFFLSKTVSSPFPGKYVLEMNMNWFKDHHVNIGDKITWNGNAGQVIKTASESQKAENASHINKNF